MDKLLIADVFKYLPVFGITIMPLHLDTEQLLGVINNMCCPLEPPTNEPQLLVNCLMPALLHDLVSNVGGKLMLSEGQEWANFINCCLYFVVLIPAQ